jgi:hypothetical protein
MGVDEMRYRFDIWIGSGGTRAGNAEYEMYVPLVAGTTELG